MLNYHIKKRADNSTYLITSINGKALLSIAQLNKGTAFTSEERHAFGLIGKLPSRIETLEEQAARAYLQYANFDKQINRNLYLNQLLNTNQTLFFKLVKSHADEMLPTIYTPIVGNYVQTYHKRFMHPRGLYISYEDQDYIEEILDNRTNANIDLIVVSDGEGVLGIGDQGIGAMAIPIAKLMVYSLFGGINPNNTLPIMLDAGTNNNALRTDPLYLGSRNLRIEGEKYNLFIDKFIAAIKNKFPNVYLHWEDFGRSNAYRNLIAYRDQMCTFNDDIQGTGVVALAAILSALKKTHSTLAEQRIVVFGGGTAGMGVADFIYQAMVQTGIDAQTARDSFWIVDKQGLLTEYCDEITPAQKPFVRKKEQVVHWKANDKNHLGLLEVVENVKPTVLIGASSRRDAFTKTIIKTMVKYTERPVILPLSNPTDYAEAQPVDIISWTKGAALIATGSPFSDVHYKDNIYKMCQCNNYLAFPGIGLGIIAIKSKRLSNTMLAAAADALANFAYQHCEALLPVTNQVGAASKAIAIAVAEAGIKEGYAGITLDKPIAHHIENIYWEPHYLPYEHTKKSVLGS